MWNVEKYKVIGDKKKKDKQILQHKNIVRKMQNQTNFHIGCETEKVTRGLREIFMGEILDS